MLDCAHSIEATGLRISKTVKALRAFARDGENDPVEAVPLANIFGDTLELCRERFRSAGIELKVREPRQGLSVYCRPVQITQVLLNLLNNAFDAVNSLKEDRWAELSCTERSGQCEISVINGGPPFLPKFARA